MNDVNVTEALLKAILELIEKCETLEELRERVKRIMERPLPQTRYSNTQKGEPGALPRPP